MRFPLMRNNISADDLAHVIQHLQNPDPKLTQGPKVREFEEAWSSVLGVKHSVFVNSGSSANLLSLAVLKIKHPQGGEVIVPPLTWISDIAAVIHCGFTPVFVDIDPKTLAMNSTQVLARLNEQTRAVFLTHVQGFDGLDDMLLDALAARNIPLIEDVCESHGARHNGQLLGSFGWMSNFSFYYAHHLSTIEGGMISTNDPEAYQILRMLRGHGMVREADDPATRAEYQQACPDLNPDFIFAYPAWNMRNNEIGGILGLSQLERFEDIVKRRNENHQRFLDRLDPGRFYTDFTLAGASNYAFNLILRDKDTELAERLWTGLRANGVEFRRGSAGGGNQLRQPYLKKWLEANVLSAAEKAPYRPEEFPACEHIHFYGCYIGNFPSLDASEIDILTDIIARV